MIATIELDDMEFYAFHGCYAEEQRVGNRFIVNLSLDVECERAAVSDNIADAANYLEAYEIVRHQMAEKSHLLENVAARIAAELMSKLKPKGLRSGKVKISKMTPPVGGAMRSVSVTMNFNCDD